MQAANTGLTEGSTPNGHYDRDIVIISTLRVQQAARSWQGRTGAGLSGHHALFAGKSPQTAGTRTALVIGSSCIGASVIGGICNNSGGSLVQRGPAYTEMSLFARINEDGKLTLVNHLGLIWAKRERSLASWMMIASKMTNALTMVVTPTIITMSTAFVILKPTRPHVITPIRIRYLNLPVAPEAGRLCGTSRYLRSGKKSAGVLSAPTSRSNPPKSAHIFWLTSKICRLPGIYAPAYRRYCGKIRQNTLPTIQKSGTTRCCFFNLRAHRCDAGESEILRRILPTVRCAKNDTCSPAIYRRA